MYVDGEASADTVAAVEQFAAADPEIGRLIDAARRLELEPPPPRRPNKEKEVLSMTKRLLTLRSVLLALAVFCSAVSFTVIHVKGVTFFLLRDHPRSAAVYALLAVLFWIGYFLVRRRLRVSGV